MSLDLDLEANVLDPTIRAERARLVVRHGRVESVHSLTPVDAPASPEPPIPPASPGGTAKDPVLRLPPDYLVVPGFVDAHTHLVGLGLERLRPNSGGASSREDALARVADWLARNPGPGPVIGEGWDQSEWSDPAMPTRAELDAICSDRPLALRRVCGHVAVFNSRALESLGTAHEGLNPASGLAYEHLPLTIGRLWPPAPAVMDAAVRLGQDEAWRRGVTAIHEMGHPGTFRAFGRAQAGGTLRLRVTHFFPIERLDAVEAAGLVPGLGGDWLRVGGVKFFLDGSIGGRSAAVREPYPAAPGVDPGGRGILLWEDRSLAEALKKTVALGLAPALHAIGDRAIEQAVTVVEGLRAEGLAFPAPGPRLEHAEMLDRELLDRAAGAGFLFSMQPNFTARWQHAGGLYERVLSARRAAALNPYRMVALTERLVFGSDTMPLDPLLGLAGALRHPVPEARLCFPSALRRYTRAAAAAISHPFGNGTLEPGAPADFAVLRLPPGLSFPFAAGVAGTPGVERAEVAATWVGGACVHSDPGFPAGAIG